MDISEFVKTGCLTEALALLHATVKQQPVNFSARRALFDLNCVLGRFDKAVDQLNSLVSLDASHESYAVQNRALIGCEKQRVEVFSGRQVPLLFGEPPTWAGAWCEAHRLAAVGYFEAASQLRIQALDVVEMNPGKINNSAFADISDSDSRLGPVLEMIVDGKYFWVPWGRIKSIETQPPSQLVDLVWLPGKVIWINGGEALAYLPIRYPGTELSEDNQLRLARRTEWEEKPSATYLGKGQKLFFTDESEVSILECRRLEFDASIVEPSLKKETT